MTDMISVVARAIFPWVDLPPSGPRGLPHTIPWEGDKAIQAMAAEKAMCRDIAKAAIKAHEKALEAKGLVIVPREPSEARLRAVDAAIHNDWPNAKKMALAAYNAALEGKE